MNASPGQPVVLHWIYPHADGPIRSNGLGRFVELHGGRFKIACRPGRSTTKGYQCTDLASIVTCPECRASKAFRALPEEQKGCRPVWDESSTAEQVLDMLEGKK